MNDATRWSANRAHVFTQILPQVAGGLRVGVKDLIDVEGVITTAGSRFVASHATPALRDAQCLAGFRQAGADLVGKTNLHELAFGTTGVNAAYGTPINPLNADWIPGGSSSGSAVAVAMAACDVALGTDTGGSVRIPSACCGIAGLKTSYGRVSLDGVWPLASSLDIVGPMARDLAGLTMGMQLLEPGFRVANDHSSVVGRVQVSVLDPRIDRAVDHALSAAGFTIKPTEIFDEQWDVAVSATDDIIVAEAASANAHLQAHWHELASERKLRYGEMLGADRGRMERAYERQTIWRSFMAEQVAAVGLLALPTIPIFPPSLRGASANWAALSRLTSPISLSGLPAIAIPIRSEAGIPASLQLVGPPGSEDMLLAAGAKIEASQSD